MSQSHPSDGGAQEGEAAPESPDRERIRLGQKEHDDTKTRQVQANSNSENSLQINITEFGVNYHGVEKGQLMEVVVCEQGILIKDFDVSGDEQ